MHSTVLSAALAALILPYSLIAAEPAAPEIDIQPENFSCSMQAQFNVMGKVRRSNSSSNSNLTFKITPPAGLILIGTRDVQVTECITDAGESMVPKNSRRISRRTELNNFQDYQRDQNEYSVNCQLGGLSQMPNGFRSIKGSVILVVANGASKQARITPIKEWVGKPVEIESIHEVVVIERTASEVKFTGSANLFESIQKFIFADAKGHEIRTGGWGSNSSNQEEVRTYTIALPEDGTITLQLLPETKEIPLPFAFTDLSLQAAPKVNRENAVKLKTEDIQAVPPAVPEGKKATAEGVKDTSPKNAGF